ncbi:MAG: M15 family metallopeptidase [Prevotellaceae bacterium]|jgi:peptidoglycan L-alanyl-D-glutamate endopeptidase CwlK|nr:M15 family metallopeptidase [Prevotellaceae bacterium]
MDARTQQNLKGIHPALVQVVTRALQISATPFIVTDGVRTTAQQQALYAKGRTAPGSIVTQCDGVRNKSPHQVHSDGYGYAVDMYPDINRDGIVNSVEISNTAISYLKEIAKAMKQAAKELGTTISWGGDWTSFKDYPHFELKNFTTSLQKKTNIFPLVIIAAILAVVLSSCATKKKILTNENAVIENHEKNTVHTDRDSIYIYITDSVYIDSRGDTVFVRQKIKEYIYKDKIIKDTVIHRDTTFVDKTEYVFVEKPPDKWDKIFNLTGKISFGIIFAILIYLLLKLKKFFFR